MREELVTVNQVSKSFHSGSTLGRFWGRMSRTVLALTDFSMAIPAGSVTGLIGPNGAGKTTLINIICDLIRADHGRVEVCGMDVSSHARTIKQRIGLVTTNDRSFFWRLSGRQNLHFFGALYGLTASELRHRSKHLLETFDMASSADRLFRSYSTGMKKRLALVRALLHDPDVLLFDEPTSNLDADAAAELLEIVGTRVAQDGKGVLWASHLMDEVMRVCDRVVVLIEGRNRFNNNISEFKDLCTFLSGCKVTYSVSSDLKSRIMNMIVSLGGQIENGNQRSTANFSEIADSESVRAAVRELVNADASIYSVQPMNRTMSEIFSYFKTIDENCT
jgi:ABC-2 type transport system ATP-binding protein